MEHFHLPPQGAAPYASPGACPTDGATAVLERPDTRQTARLAPQYRVMIHNDDVTPMNFVVATLQEIFKKELEAAANIMLEAHHTGVALVTVLPLEHAEFRVEQAHSKARAAKYPLAFSIEPVD